MMENIKREKIIDNTKEFLTSFDWDFKIVTAPKAVYWPGEETFQLRADSIDPPPSPTNELISTTIRSYKKSQAGLTMKDGQFTMTLQDYEDQTMAVFLMDYVNKMNNPVNMRKIHTSQLLMDVDLFRLNSSGKAIKVWRMRDVLLSTHNIPDEMTSEQTPLGKITATFNVDFYTVTPLNVA